MRFIEDAKPKLLRNDIQQIRAISVIAVVLFHSFPNKIVYGYLGVDVFFFLSGFLIFPQIYDIAKSTSKNSLILNVKEFTLRRIYRIAPALGFCIFSSLGAVLFLVLAQKIKWFRVLHLDTFHIRYWKYSSLKLFR